MGASIEILSGLIRLGPEHFKFGDPYTVSLAFSVDEDEAILKGLDQHITYENGREIIEILRQYGLRRKRHRRRSIND